MGCSSVCTFAMRLECQLLSSFCLRGGTRRRQTRKRPRLELPTLTLRLYQTSLLYILTFFHGLVYLFLKILLPFMTNNVKTRDFLKTCFQWRVRIAVRAIRLSPVRQLSKNWKFFTIWLSVTC